MLAGSRGYGALKRTALATSPATWSTRPPAPCRCCRAGWGWIRSGSVRRQARRERRSRRARASIGSNRSASILLSASWRRGLSAVTAGVTARAA